MTQVYRHFVLLFSFLLSFSYVHTQFSSLKNYYQFINAAEQCIMSGKKDSSLVYYQMAFKERKPFARDLFNAAVVAAELKMFPDVAGYLTSLLQLGASKTEAKNIPAFHEFFQSKPGKALLAAKRQFTYNVAYRDSIEWLIKRDQLFRKTVQSYSGYGDTIRNIDKENVLKFMELVNRFGFPTEEKVGITGLEGLIVPVYSILVIHQSAGSMQQYDFSLLLKENILNGNIENKAGYYMLNRVTGRNFFDIVKIQYVRLKDSVRALNPNASTSNPNNIILLDSTDWGYFPVGEKQVKDIDDERSKYFLDGYDVFRSKVLFSIKNDRYKLAPFGAKSILNYATQELFEKEKNALKFHSGL